MHRVPERGMCRNYRPKSATPEGDVKLIPLGDGVYTYVDAADYEWLSQWTWHLQGGYAVRWEKRRMIFMHREIMPAPKGMIVDHKNRNKLDNTRVNLRACTASENARNRDKPRGMSSRFRGVSYRKDCGKWYARIRFEGRLIHLGSFSDEVEAARAYDRQAVELFGEFARLNFPEEWPAETRQEVYARREDAAKKAEVKRRKAAGRRQQAAGKGKRAKGKESRRRTRPAQRKARAGRPRHVNT
jgi:hypothetical protein